MAAKKSTKKAAKKATKASKKTAKKATKTVEPVKEAKKEDKITIKASHFYIGIIAIGLIIIAVILAKNIDMSSEPKITILNDEECVSCDTTSMEQALGQLFPETEIVTVDISSKDGKKLADTGIPGVPAYFLDEELSQTEAFQGLVAEMSEAFIETEYGYYINPQINGIGPRKIFMEVDIEGRHMLGDPNAPETIIEFSEFECPYCGKFYDDFYSDLKEQYIETGKANLVFMHFPLSFHAQAKPAAMAAECAGDQDKFWEMHDILFENREGLSAQNYTIWAEDLGLDMTAFNECISSGKYSELIDSDFAKGVNAYVGGTPSFIVKNEVIVGAQPVSTFESILG